MAEKRIKVVPMMRGTAWDEKTEYKLVDYIVVDGSVMYMCRKVDSDTGVCIGHPLTDSEWWDKCIDLGDVMAKAENAATEAQNKAEEATRATTNANLATKAATTSATNADTARKNAETATASANAAATSASNAATAASKVDATITEESVLEVTDREGAKKTLSLVTAAKAEEIDADVERIKQSLGSYSERPTLTLVAKETDVAVSKDGVKVSKQGWAIAEFTAELGNEYLFKPGVTDGNVCVFAELIDKVETRAIDYQTTYDEQGRVVTATATYGGKTYVYTYDYSGTQTVITDQSGQVVQQLPLVYTTAVGGYSVLTRLNEDAELPEDGYCRFVSNFQSASAIKVAVSYKVGAADLTMRVVRDGMTASMCTQLSKINKKVDDVAQSVPKMWINVCSTKDTALMVDGERVEIPAHRTTILYPTTSVSVVGNTPIPECITRFEIHNYGMFSTSFYFSGNFAYTNGTGTFAMGVKTLNLSAWDVSKVNNFAQMFAMCKKLTSLDVSGWDTSNAYTMAFMFYNCAVLTSLDVSGWDVSNVNNMRSMFSYSGTNNLNISNWDTSSVKNMDGMFEASTIKELKNNRLCNKSTTTIRAIFNDCSNLTTLDASGWDTSNVINMYSAFQNCVSLKSLDVSGWDTSNVIDMYSAFQNCVSLKSLDVSGWDTSNVIDMHQLFMGCKSLQNIDLSNFDLSTTENIYGIFTGCTSLATLTFGEGFGKMKDECGTLDLSELSAWNNDSVKSLLKLYDRKSNGMGVITIKLHANAKAVLGEDGIAELTAKGYTIA